ncbi:hypothetical protein BFJ70_g13285 [Fusarium oxysporum]|nr:hypothetical protein BFJ70_g13285 [Fusarium oxysporum]
MNLLFLVQTSLSSLYFAKFPLIYPAMARQRLSSCTVSTNTPKRKGGRVGG